MCICLDSLVMEEKAQSEGRMARAKKCLLLSIVTEPKEKNNQIQKYIRIWKYIHYLLSIFDIHYTITKGSRNWRKLIIS